MYVCDKDVGVTSFALSVSVIEYQTLVLRGELDAANEMLPEIPDDQKNKIARFLEGQGYKEQALEVATDSEHRFELALGLGQLDVALELAREADVEHKWKTVGDAALSGWDLKLAEECFLRARDLGSLLLIYSSSSNPTGLRELATKAQAAGQHNVAFASLWQIGDVDACLDLLLSTNRTAEAVLLARTYRPSRCRDLTLAWKDGLDKSGKPKVARSICVPGDDDDDDELFPEWDESLRLEKQNGGGVQQDLIDVGVNGSANDEDADVTNGGGDDDDDEGDDEVEDEA